MQECLTNRHQCAPCLRTEYTTSALDRMTVTADNPQPVVSGAKEADAIHENAKISRTIICTSPRRSAAVAAAEALGEQICLSPISEDLRLSGSNGQSVSESISAVTYVASASSNVSASGTMTRLIAPTAAVSSSVKVRDSNSFFGSALITIALLTRFTNEKFAEMVNKHFL
ncbi:unnamed protein product [Gongylonema pulchrum]|uniref:Cellulase n=1 Tax=Gongylonema pulchrum TaxID=637853 RepID=A0A183DAS3_9BILA|nr:unnamed protein product [Gongylonema pulchrum]